MTEIKTAAAWGQIWNDDAEQHAGVLIPRARGVKRHVDTRNESTLTRVVPVVIVHGLTESEVHEAAGLLAKSREVCEWVYYRDRDCSFYMPVRAKYKSCGAHINVDTPTKFCPSCGRAVKVEE